MFSAKTWFNISKDLTDVWADLEDKTNLTQTNELLKNANKGDLEWYKSQLKNIPNFQDKVVKIAKDHLKRANKEAVEAIKKAIEYADIETLKAIKAISGSEGSLDNKEEFIASSIERINDFNKGRVNVFINSAVVRNNQFINNINSDNSRKKKASYRTKNDTADLYKTIEKQTEIGIAKGVPFTYKDGKQMPFKAHMEMSVRTFIQNQTVERMEKSSKNLGIIFFLASEHANCADDHADYQGKVYVNDNWETSSLISNDTELKNKIKEYISKNDIKTLQWVKSDPVYLSTRPNCGHIFLPITVKQALGDIKELKTKLRMARGTYQEENYQDLKRQRQIERYIRFYKQRKDNSILIYNKNKDQKTLDKISHDKDLVLKWQKEQRKLILSNKNLMRDYKREDVNKMAQDLGVKINLREEKKKQQANDN